MRFAPRRTLHALTTTPDHLLKSDVFSPTTTTIIFIIILFYYYDRHYRNGVNTTAYTDSTNPQPVRIVQVVWIVVVHFPRALVRRKKIKIGSRVEKKNNA